MAIVRTELESPSVELDSPKFRSLILFVIVAAATFFQKPAPALKWDAAEYLRGSMALVSGRNIYEEGGLALRGAWTPIIYSPAAAVNQVFGGGGYGGGLYVVVLLQGALLVAAICVFLLPAVMRIWYPQNSSSVFVCVTLGFIALRSFAPYSLMDTWAVALLLLAICLLAQHGIASLFFAGLALGVCVSIRPSYLLTAVVIMVVAITYLRFRGLIILIGFVVAQFPQLAVNWFVNEKMAMFPVDLAGVSRRANTFSSFMIRYDTVAYQPDALGGQAFCDPAMTSAALKQLPSGTGELVIFFVTRPIATIQFLVEKLGAMLLWPITVPYFEWISVLNLLFGATIVLITTLGISGLVLTRTESPILGLTRAAALAVIAGVIVNLILYTTETRYAISLVLLGIVGVAGLAGHIVNRGIHRANIRGGLPSVIAVITFAVVLILSGHQGLQYADSCPSEAVLNGALTKP